MTVLAGRPPLAASGTGWLERTQVVTPAMCGHNSLFVGQLGDWTWDAVGATCGLDPYTAVDDAGRPAYLSFAYFRVASATGLTTESIGFGDRLAVRSKVLTCGRSSVLALHQVQREPTTGSAPARLADFFARTAPHTIHAETFNRWISRSRADTNHDLRTAAPAGFDGGSLDPVPDEFSPRVPYTQVRRHGSFRSPDDPAADVHVALQYPVEASRDLNGAGLLYFASYFSIVDWAIVRLWREAGRDASRFLAREVLDRQVCFLGNADADDVLDVAVSSSADGEDEVVDVVLRRAGSGAVLAAARQRIRDHEGGPA
ncbi:biosynthesis cluster domain-containing protein [Jatrophihabitans endophyticus]|uniref:Biosynthesis cluster domain-containing protein n=1 Tax=Jatrophihabitans endophyticus TaxID=1206085 RepID=A0A1M5I5Y6_9ACTN|nr:LnmK family bifunctional acyltransferase/decarboxylase [Jatrophihabitans endophyticus]SHG23607.1 biosynthesis cluster domain-containing protein [Jatrophihabitans endophyticus]